MPGAQCWPLLRPTLLVLWHGAGVRLLYWGVRGCLTWLLESTGNLCSHSEMQEATERQAEEEVEEVVEEVGE